MRTKTFWNNPWSRELIIEHYGPTARVYLIDAIFDAFDISQAKELIRLLNKHAHEIAGAEDAVKLMAKSLNDHIDNIYSDYGYCSSDGVFEVMHFLETMSEDITSYYHQQEYLSDYLCWPVDDRDSLEGCFKEYHVYKFYEKYMNEIPGGVELFLNMIPDLQGPIQKTQISDDFFWNRTDVSFLYEYREAKRALIARSSLSSKEA